MQIKINSCLTIKDEDGSIKQIVVKGSYWGYDDFVFICAIDGLDRHIDESDLINLVVTL